MGKVAVDTLGRRYGRLVVTASSGVNKNRSSLWLCRCDCGEEVVLSRNALQSGNTRSCGCLMRDTSSDTVHKRNQKLGYPGGLTREYRDYRNNALKQGRAWELSYDQALSLMTSACHYCGSAPATTPKTVRLNKVSARNGIDRVNNDMGGYTLENCVPCCIICNRAKHALPLSDFLSWVSRIATHQGFTQFNPPPIQEDSNLKWTVM